MLSCVSSIAHAAASQGQRYLDFIIHLDDENSLQKAKSLFFPDIKKIINLRVICSDRNTLLQQMIDVWDQKRSF